MSWYPVYVCDYCQTEERGAKDRLPRGWLSPRNVWPSIAVCPTCVQKLEPAQKESLP